MIDRNHPAVEAGAEGMEYPHIPTAHDAITAALPHLTADDLRDTPAGRALKAEGWDALIESMSASGEFHDVDLRTMERLNPYREGDA